MSHTHSHSHAHTHPHSPSHANGTSSLTPRKRKSSSFQDIPDTSQTQTHTHKHTETKETSNTPTPTLSSQITPAHELMSTPLIQLVLDPRHLTSTQLHDLSLRIFTESGCLSSLSIPVSALSPLLTTIYSTHRSSNGYHNQYHAFHVLLNTYRFIYKTKQMLPDIDLFGVLLAAVCHDLDHCGISNRLLIERHAPIATLYTDKSPLEQNSIDKTLSIITDTANGTDIITYLNQDDKSRLITLISDLIMATDITDPATSATIKKDWARCVTRFRPQNPGHRCALLRMTLMCADIGVVTEPFDIFISWAGCLLDEIHASMDLEWMTSYDFALDRNQAILSTPRTYAWMRGRHNCFLQQHQTRMKQTKGEKITIPRSVFSPTAASHKLNDQKSNNTSATTTSTTAASTDSSTCTSPPASSTASGPPLSVPSAVPPSISQFYYGQIAFLEGYARPLYTSVISSSLVPSLIPYLTSLDRNINLIKKRGRYTRNRFQQQFHTYSSKRGKHVEIQQEDEGEDEVEEEEEVGDDKETSEIKTETSNTNNQTTHNTDTVMKDESSVDENGSENGNKHGFRHERSTRPKSKR